LSWPVNRLPARPFPGKGLAWARAWLANDVPAAGALPAAWLKRGASASELLQVQPDDHAAVLKVRSKRHRDLDSLRT
jgi:hypothetical protein